MYCLWNGEYEEHDVDHATEVNYENMKKQYQKWPGTVVGDFTCLEVEYDYGRRDQRWKVKCNLCGEISHRYHVADWRRGKGQKITCHCRKDKEIAEKEAKKNNAVQEKESLVQQHLNHQYGDWKVIEYSGYKKCKIECIVCGKTRKNVNIDNVVNSKLNPCNHKIPIDYSNDEWIGKRNEHLTIVGRNGKMFVAKCDCGNEIVVKPTYMFTYKIKKDCGSSECPYSTPKERKARDKRIQGFGYERTTEYILISQGYNVIKTQDQSDFGVDIIITENNCDRIAVQCKFQEAPAGVNAIQEVYAGGRYYDCNKFAVISKSGFSNSAILMARKLGIYLCEENHNFKYPDNLDSYLDNLLPIHRDNKKLEKLYEIDGEKHTLADWSLKYNVPIYEIRKRLKAGATIETAIKTPYTKLRKEYTVRGFTGNLGEICKHFEVSEPYVTYRMKKNGMTLEDAIFEPKKIIGRPKKNNQSQSAEEQITFQEF